MEPRRGKRALELTVAFRANQFRLGREVLYFLETMAALGAAIGIQRQGFSTLKFKIKHYAYCTGRAVILCNPGALPMRFVLIRNQCADTGTEAE